MTIKLFIHIFERIIDNSCNIREKNTIKTINNIVNKYEFFNCLISINNIEVIEYFINSQKIYMNMIKNKNINKILSKKYILFNNINLELDNFKVNSFNIYLGKLLYKFDFNDFKNLILTSYIILII